MSRNALNCSLKNDIDKYGSGYMIAKYRQNLKFGLPDLQVWFYNKLYVKKMDFGKFDIKISVFIFLGRRKIIFGKSEITSFESLLFYTFLMSFICILLEASIFGDFSNIYQISTKVAWHWVT